MGSSKLLLKLLKSSLESKKVILNIDRHINWNEIFDLLNYHQITSLGYNVIDRENFANINSSLLEDWKRKVIKLNMYEIIKLNRYSKILSELSKLQIDIIGLKGIVLKGYYPQPELRTMGDLDILIHKEDYEKIKNYLLDNGFKAENEGHPVHTEFVDKHGISIEVHWKLINEETYVGDVLEFEKGIWNNLIDFKIGDLTIKTLSKEDFLIHLCIHMAKHLRGTGFGLRQVYDVAAFSIKEEKNINWEVFELKAKQCGVLKFTITLFNLINNIFELHLYTDILNKNSDLDCDVSTLLDEILSYNVDKNSERKIWLSDIKLSSDKLFSYERAHKQYVLMKRKVRNTFKDKEVRDIINRREKLLKQFEL